MESPSAPASSSIAAPVPQQVVFPIAQSPMRPAAAVAGGRPGDLPAAASGGASQGAVGPIRIVNLAGEIITDGQPPSGSGPPGGPPCPRFLQWDPDRKKYRKRKGEVPPPSIGGGGGGGSPGPGDEDDGSTSNSSSATSQITRSAKSGRNALTRKKEATEVRFDRPDTSVRT